MGRGPSAKNVSLSFTVYTTVAGTYAGSIRNGVADRSYVFTYNVPSVLTFTNIVVTIPGDVAGTWLVNGNTIAMIVGFNLGCGPAWVATAANTWPFSC